MSDICFAEFYVDGEPLSIAVSRIVSIEKEINGKGTYNLTNDL